MVILLRRSYRRAANRSVAPRELKPQIPWLRVFVEGVVIVGSILLALGLDHVAGGAS